MDKQTLKDVLIYQDSITRTNVIPRTLEPIIKKELHSPFVVIISGIRRCGKSTLLLELKHNAYYVNFDDERFINLTVADFALLEETLYELFGEREFFIFDEIQNISGWERFVRRLHEADKKVFVTGSNATMLSKELGTHLTGRTVSYTLYPFSFKEFLLFKNISFDHKNLSVTQRAQIKKTFLEFMYTGGFPEFLKTNNVQYLQSLYENILYRDIITRYKLTAEQAVKQTALYATSNLGKLVSYNQVRKLVGLSSATTVREYLDYFENSFLFFQLAKFDHSLKAQSFANKKIYCIDSGLASYVGFRMSKDSGRMLENIVFIQLKRLGKEIYYSQTTSSECDFVIKEGMNIVKAIQVCYDLHEENEKREIKGLIEACKTHKLRNGLLLTYDQEDSFEKDGVRITVMPVWKWLIS